MRTPATSLPRVRRPAARRAGFTLLEVVIVVVIIAILAAMAIPRLARGSDRAQLAALARDVNILQKAIYFYAADHDGAHPGERGGDVADQLTLFTDADGKTSDNQSGRYRYGPYVVSIPACPIGIKADAATIVVDSVNSPPRQNAGSTAGWVYNPRTGEIRANIGRDTVGASVEEAEQLGIAADAAGG